MKQLYASSSSIEGIIKSIESFWYRNDITLKPIENSKVETYTVFAGEKQMNFSVIKKGKKYRFESND